MAKRILIYGFPFFLMFLEVLLRKAYKLDSEEFIGPTLAAVGISFLLPLIVPRRREYPFSQQTTNELNKQNVVVVNRSEDRFIDIVWILIFLLTGLWAYSLYISAAKSIAMWWVLPNYKVIGFANYFVGVLCSELKEVF